MPKWCDIEQPLRVVIKLKMGVTGGTLPHKLYGRAIGQYIFFLPSMLTRMI